MNMKEVELMDNWENIWAGRCANVEILKHGNPKEVFLELKRCNGFDVIGDGLTFEALVKQYEQIKHSLSFGLNHNFIKSVYEVGCGSGANLYLFEKDGIECGGLDYSENLIEIAKGILFSKDLCCTEAINVPVVQKYDAILSNSVFSYFISEEYARIVLEKMYQKSNYSLGIIDIHDTNKKNEFINYRKETIPDYEERYKNLPKLFYTKDFFADFAYTHDMEIKFETSEVEGYWNNEYVFNCYMYKKSI